MHARIKFLEKAYFNFGEGHLALPAANDDVPKAMKYWTMTFESEKEISPLVFEGEAHWLVSEPLPGGELHSGFKFKLYYHPHHVIAEGLIL